MGEFLYHGPCNKCGSSDGRAHYGGGTSYCFVCSDYGGPRTSPYLVGNKPSEGTINLPDDASPELGAPAIMWAGKYQIMPEQMLQYGVLWSEGKQQLIYTWYDENKNLLAYQARNFHPSSKLKYYTKGPINEILTTYSRSCGRDSYSSFLSNSSGRISSSRCVLVEDCLSAIKITEAFKGPTIDSFACLGSGIPKVKLSRLARFYEQIDVFLDGNMYINAIKLSNQLQYLGVKSKVIYSELDPKEHSYEDLQKLIYNE